jgi:hypothetical protein
MVREHSAPATSSAALPYWHDHCRRNGGSCALHLGHAQARTRHSPSRLQMSALQQRPPRQLEPC